MTSKQQGLLAIAAVLALLQFLWLPMIQQQNEKQRELEQLSYQLARVKASVNSEAQLQQAQQQLPELLQQLAERYPSQQAGQSAGQLRLGIQQQLQQQLASHQVQLSVFDWVGQRSEPDLGFEVNQARLVVRGRLDKLMEAYLAIFEPEPGLTVQYFELRQIAGSSQQQEEANLTLLVQAVVLQPQALQQGEAL